MHTETDITAITRGNLDFKNSWFLIKNTYFLEEKAGIGKSMVRVQNRCLNSGKFEKLCDTGEKQLIHSSKQLSGNSPAANPIIKH